MDEYFFGITDKGKRRDKNEDRYIVTELNNRKQILACVIDGVGGYTGGDIAAGIAVSVIKEYLQDIKGNTIDALTEAVNKVNEKIKAHKKNDRENEQMACVLTCVIADIENNRCYYAHVGDTRLYLLRDQTLVKVSKDHSVVGYLEESGHLSEEDAMQHPRRNEITKALGFEEDISKIKDFIETGESPFLPGDTLLLCSDGLSDMIGSANILSILNREDKIKTHGYNLINAANEAGGNDNITVVLVQNKNKQGVQVALKPKERKTNDSKSKLHVIKDVPAENITVKAKRRQSMMTFVSLLLFGLLVVLLFQKNTNGRKNTITIKPKIVMPKHELLNELLMHTKDTSKKWVLRDSVLKLNQAITIDKDSFQFFGKGNIIVADSGYKGPAFIISNNAKQVIFDSLVFKNFESTIVIVKNNISLKNVRFTNCKAPVQYTVTFPDSIINGRFKDTLFIPVKKAK